MNGGDDTFPASGNLLALIQLTVDGRAGNDTISGGNGADLLLGGNGNDFIDGQQGNDVAFLGAGNDVFQWDPGDGNDTVEGQAGTDTLRCNGSGANENIDIAANGERVHLIRDVGNVTMDFNDVETISISAQGGTDTITVNDLTGTDVSQVRIGGLGDGQVDTIVINGTGGNDNLKLTMQGDEIVVSGLSAAVVIQGAEAQDRIVIQTANGDDTIDASALPSSVGSFIVYAGVRHDYVRMGGGNDVVYGQDGHDIVYGGAGVDYLSGGYGDDRLFGEASNDLLDGSPGFDVLVGGSGTNTYLNGEYVI